MVEIIKTKRGPVEYRMEGSGPAVLVLNGGHTNCCSPFEHEKFFIHNGYKIIIPSRPGYGRTPSSSGKTAEAFSDTLIAFLDALNIDKVIVLGISAAGRTALHLTKLHPNRVVKLILESAVTCEKWPDLRTKMGAILFFNRFVESMTWAMFRFIGRSAPNLALRMMLPYLSALDTERVLNGWDDNRRREVLKFLMTSRSGGGFLNDIHHSFCDFDSINVPTLIIASINDKSVSPENSTKAAAQIKGAELFLVEAESHLIWFSRYKSDIEKKISDFLANNNE